MTRPHPALILPSRLPSHGLAVLAKVGAILLAALLVGATAAHAQSTLPIVYKGELEGLDSLDHYCKRDTMNALLGPPIGRDEVDREFRLRKAVHAYSFQFVVRSEDGEKREPLYIGLYSFQDIPAVMNLGPTILETLGIPRARAILKDVKSCPPVYTAEPAKRTSLPHSNLLVTRKRATIFEGTRLQIAYVMAMYVGRAKVGAGTVLPPVGGIGPSDDGDVPPGVAGVPKQPSAKAAPPAAPDAGPKQPQAPAPAATPDKSGPRPPAVATAPPKAAAPDAPKDGKAPPAAVQPAPQPPAAATPAPKMAQGAKPPAQTGALSPEALAKEQENCARGETLSCMIVDRYKAVLGAPKAAPPSADPPPPPKAASPAPPPPKVAAPVAPSQPPPAPAAPRQPDAGADGKGATGDPPGPKQDDGAAPAPVKQSKRYPAPAYPLLAQPVAPLDAKGREAFVVESIECSEDGNLIVGFVGELKGLPGGKGALTIRSRFAINNYPAEGRSKRDQLASAVAGFACGADGRSCSAPRKTIPLIEYRKLIEGEGASADPKAVADEWRCVADKGVCYNRKVDTWRCDPSSGECTSFDETRMWCIPRREFCSQTAPFGDWMSPFKAGDVLNVRIAPSVDASGSPIRDTRGNPVFENHVYDMAHGLVPIAEDALMRRCAGYSGPSRTWTSSFPSN